MVRTVKNRDALKAIINTRNLLVYICLSSGSNNDFETELL